MHAVPEGTIFFPDEPIIRVTAPIAEAQLVEPRLMNLLHFETLIARRKRSEGKATWPGRKQVYRRYDDHGLMREDVLTLESDPQDGEPLVRPVMRAGRRIAPGPSLAESRARATADLARLPERLRRLEGGARHPVQVSPALVALAHEVDERTR